MIHKFDMNGVKVVMDIFSGAVHVVDGVLYDIVEAYEAGDRQAVYEALVHPMTKKVWMKPWTSWTSCAKQK